MQDESKRSLPPLEAGQETGGRRLARALVVLFLLVVAIIGFIYGYPKLRDRGILLAELPRVRESLATVGKRMDGIEESLRAWSSQRDGLEQRMAKLENKLGHSFQLARNQTRDLGLQVLRLRAELDGRTQRLQARLEGLESSQESERLRVAKLQEEMAGLRKALSQQVTLAREDASRDAANLDQRLVSLDRQVERNQHDLHAVADDVARRRVDFEVRKRHPQGLAPGVSLEITRTNVSRRRFDGWVWLLPERRTVWVHDQSVRRPVLFYIQGQSRPHELVITHVAKNGVVGYVLLPGGSDKPGPGKLVSSVEGPAANSPSQ